MEPSIRITAKQIRFLLGSGRAWAVQHLHVADGVPAELRGNYAVPLDEQRRHGWGLLDEATELGVLRSWVALGYKLASEQKRKEKRGRARLPQVQLTLLPVDGTFAVCRLAADSSIPTWAAADHFFSITRTAGELSVVCRQDAVPEGVACERGWRCLRVAGTMPFSVVGVLASLTAPLAHAGISVFALSTFDTDYLLVKAEDLGRAVDTLRQHGHTVQYPK